MRSKPGTPSLVLPPSMTKQYIALLTEHKVKLLCLRERMMIDSSNFSPFSTKKAECPLQDTQIL